MAQPLSGSAELAAEPGFSVSLANFEGPFDLLLSLIAKHELDITEISLSIVTGEFITYLSGIETEKELDQANAELLRYACGEIGPTVTGLPVVGSVNIGGYGGGVLRASSIVGHQYQAQARAQVAGTSVMLPLAYNSTSGGAWRGGGGGNNSSANSNASLHHKEGGDSM